MSEKQEPEFWQRLQRLEWAGKRLVDLTPGELAAQTSRMEEKEISAIHVALLMGQVAGMRELWHQNERILQLGYRRLKILEDLEVDIGDCASKYLEDEPDPPVETPRSRPAPGGTAREKGPLQKPSDEARPDSRSAERMAEKTVVKPEEVEVLDRREER